MKRKMLYAFIALMLGLPGLIHAQTKPEPVVYQDWITLEESLTLIDVSYRVIKCSNAIQIHLLVFNENNIDQTAHFELEIINNSNKVSFKKEINYATTKATIYKAECDSDNSLDKLKFELPSNFDPKNITVKITYKS
jgi:hypothetical protein